MSAAPPASSATAERTCGDCGARYDAPGDDCAARFAMLLALDHSRQEPWGSRHGLAFAVYALQHPGAHDARTRRRALEFLDRVLRRGEPIAEVVRTFRARGGDDPVADAPAPPSAGPYTVTIADLGTFDAATYAADLERWCRATLDRLSLHASTHSTTSPR
jgi:hypothetical protein